MKDVFSVTIQTIGLEKASIVLALINLLEKYPQQRVGQVIANYILPNCVNGDPFYIEDKRLLDMLISELEKDK